MVDLAPEGFIHLPACFERYCLWLWHGHYPREEMEFAGRVSTLPGERQLIHRESLAAVQNAALSEIVDLFASGKLQALVRAPGSAENLTIPPRAWLEAFFPERLFLSPEVRPGHGDLFDAAVGRTPFVSGSEADRAFRAQEPHRSKLLSRSALREALIGLVMDGVMTSKEAEKFKESWGLAPLSEYPDPTTFDPLRLPTWTFAMAVAWIAWRDIGRVRETRDDYREHCWEWVDLDRVVAVRGGEESYKINGEELRPLKPVSATSLGLLEALGTDERGGQLFSVKSAREDLWRALALGNITATGLDRRGRLFRFPPTSGPISNWPATPTLRTT